jgi:hypothetical protein
MKYSTLTATQKRCIDAFVEIKPALAKQETITRKEVEELFFALHAAREGGGPKIGYPMWLVKGERVGRGAYKFPAPGLDSAPSKSKSTAKVEDSSTKEDKEFFTELAEHGIMETA